MTVVAITIGIGLVFFAVFTWWNVQRVRRTYATQIVRRLKSTGLPIKFRLWFTDSTWDPATPKVGDRVHAPGWATYTLDDSENVHLQWQPKGKPEQHLVGPIPDYIAAEPATMTRNRRLVRRVVEGYVAFLSVGFILGFSLAGGSVARRFVVGVSALFGAMVLVSIGTTVLRVGMAVRSVMREWRNPPSA